MSSLVVAVFVIALIAGPASVGHAVFGNPSGFNPGVVRIYEQGQFVGTGVLVDRNWVLTAGHVMRADVSQYTFRFGGVDNSQDTETGLRRFDRQPVTHPDVPDLTLIHFAAPIPSGTPVASVATTNPFTPNSPTGLLFGWSEATPDRRGTTLRYRQLPVVDLEARANIDALQHDFPDIFAAVGNAVPFAVPYATSPGDSGGGFFKSGNVVGLHFAAAPYVRVNATGRLYGLPYGAAYEIPLWPYAAWIRSIINGEGTSGPPPAHDELRRRLGELETQAADAPPLMTGPAPITSPGGCDVSDSRCSTDRVTPLGVLVGPSTTNGQVLTGCAGNDTDDTCTFAKITSAKGSHPTLRLTDPPKTGIDAPTGHRDVIVWCRTTGTLTTGAPTTTLLRVSFTNTDTAGYPPGYGWWDVNPSSVQPLPDNPASIIEPDKLTPCAN